MKCFLSYNKAIRASRTPQGVRGLKYRVWLRKPTQAESHPARGAWIEIVSTRSTTSCGASHPARGAWIEMQHVIDTSCAVAVAPRKGCVD